MSDAPVLVTGGAGFIGSHVVEALLAQGQSVRVLDNFSTGKRSNLTPHPQLEVLEGNVADAAQVEQAVAGCSAVVHLAAVASVQASVDDPLGTHQSNFLGTLNLCEAMRRQGVRRVLFASSAAVYGPNGEGVAVAEDTPKAPLTPYAVDKLASEYYLDFYRRQHGFEPVIFRLFNIYGPRQDPSSPYSGVISIFIERTYRQQPIWVFGDGEQTRDFVYVEDLVQLLMQGLQQAQPTHLPVNVGLGRSTTLNQLLVHIAKTSGSGLPSVTHKEARSGDIRHSRADNQRLCAHYQLPTVTDLDEGLSRTLASVLTQG